MKLFVPYFIFLGLTLISCSRNAQEIAGTDDVQDTGIQTSSLTGTINKDSSTQVHLLLTPLDYIAGLNDSIYYSAIANSKGEFKIDSVIPDVYNLLVIDSSNNNSKLIIQIKIDSLENHQVGLIDLLPSSTIELNLSELDTSGNYLISVPGTAIQMNVSLDELNGNVLAINNIPQNYYDTLYLINLVDSVKTNLLGNPIDVNDSIPIKIGVFNLWNYSKKISFNTTVSGVELNQEIINYPLLVRLDSSNFSFSEANDIGSDIRFTNKHGVPLNYEIEDWNPSKKIGIIWVLVDTIFSLRDNHSIHIHWGNLLALSKSDGGKVFQKNLDFLGVWHLQQDKPDSSFEPIYLNSVADENHAEDGVFSQNKQGLIGRGQYFNLKEKIEISNPTFDLKPTTSLTISVWFKSDTSGTLLSMGEDYALRVNSQKDEGQIKFFLYDSIANENAVLGGAGLVDNNWHQATGVFNGSQLLLYIDGKLDTVITTTRNSIDYNRNPNFILGSHSAGTEQFDYKGYIDEARVSGIVRSEDWIRLDFESQKVDQKLWKFE